MRERSELISSFLAFSKPLPASRKFDFLVQAVNTCGGGKIAMDTGIKKRTKMKILNMAECSFCEHAVDAVKDRTFECNTCGFVVDFMTDRPKRQWFSLSTMDSKLFPRCRTCNQWMSLHNLEVRQTNDPAGKTYAVLLVFRCGEQAHAISCYARLVNEKGFHHFAELMGTRVMREPVDILSNAMAEMAHLVKNRRRREDGGYELDMADVPDEFVERIRKAAPQLMKWKMFSKIVVTEDKKVIFWKHEERMAEEASLINNASKLPC